VKRSGTVVDWEIRSDWANQKIGWSDHLSIQHVGSGPRAEQIARRAAIHCGFDQLEPA
jgi:hypothetical protein